MHGRLVKGAKGQTLENGTCEPFIVNCPGLVPESVVSDGLIDFTDLLPTFAELAGAKLPQDEQFDGHSFAQHILGKADDTQRRWILSMGGGSGTYDPVDGDVINLYHYRDRVIRDKRYKLYVETDRSSVKLVDLEEDPAELENIIDDPKLTAILNTFQEIEKIFPDEDGNPRYEPRPENGWDVEQKNPGRKSGLKGLPSNDPDENSKRARRRSRSDDEE